MPNHIKVGDITPRIQYAADGNQAVFSYPFPIFTASDLQVYLDEEPQSEGFTITGAGESQGGSLTFTTPPPAGTTVTLRRDVPVQRISDFQQGGAFRAKVINDELDRMTAQIQQIEVEANRSLKLSPSDAAEGLILPLPGGRADKLLGFNAAGQPIAEVTPGAVMEANQRAQDAEQARDEAQTARDQAQAARNSTQRYRNDAQTARNQAANERQNARRYRNDAQTARDQAIFAAAHPNITIATSTEARTGTNTSKLMTPLRTKEAIDDQRPLASNYDIRYRRGSNNIMTVQRTREAIEYQRPFATQAEARTGTNNTKIMTPLRTREALEYRSARLFSWDSPHWQTITTPGDDQHYYPVLISDLFTGDIVIRRAVHAQETLYERWNGSLIFSARSYNHHYGAYPDCLEVLDYKEEDYTTANNRTPQFIARIKTDVGTNQSHCVVWLRGNTEYEIWQSSGQAEISNAQGAVGRQNFGILDHDITPDIRPNDQQKIGTPVGSLMLFPVGGRKTGFLLCHGAPVQQSRYRHLFAVIGHTFALTSDTTTWRQTHFRLPDYRAMFLRGADNSRGLDPGRVIGSRQNDSIRSHSHRLHILAEPPYGPLQNNPGIIGYNHIGPWLSAQSRQHRDLDMVQPGRETRPVNMAVGIHIKY